MAVLQISWADELKAQVEARAAEAGYDSVEKYLEALVRADLDGGGPEDADLEELLLHRLDSGPGIKFTAEFAEQFRREVRERRASKKQSPK